MCPQILCFGQFKMPFVTKIRWWIVYISLPQQIVNHPNIRRFSKGDKYICSWMR